MGKINQSRKSPNKFANFIKKKKKETLAIEQTYFGDKKEPQIYIIENPFGIQAKLLFPLKFLNK